MVSSRGKKVGFCRTLWGPMLTDWERILNSCDQVRLLDSGDKVWWTLTQNGKFTVSSFYKKLMWQNVDFPHEFLWKIRIPLKIWILLWLMIHKSILTKEVLQHRGWKGDTQYCGLEETINHLFLQCPLARFLWNIVRCAFDLLALPATVSDVWDLWIPACAGRLRKLIMVGVAGVFWAIWNIRNNACFRNVKLHPLGLLNCFVIGLNCGQFSRKRRKGETCFSGEQG